MKESKDKEKNYLVKVYNAMEVNKIITDIEQEEKLNQEENQCQVET